MNAQTLLPATHSVIHSQEKKSVALSHVKNELAFAHDNYWMGHIYNWS